MLAAMEVPHAPRCVSSRMAIPPRTPRPVREDATEARAVARGALPNKSPGG